MNLRTMKSYLSAALLLLATMGVAHAQCDTLSVDFGEASWGLAPDGLTTFFDTAYVDVEYADEIHLLVPTTASEVDSTIALDAPIDSVVISGVVLLDTLSGAVLTFEEVGLTYICNNFGDCADPCTFLSGSQYCANFEGTPTVSGDFVLSMEVEVWVTIFGFPISQPFSFDGFPFPIVGNAIDHVDELNQGVRVFPNPVQGQVSLSGARGAQAVLRGMDGRSLRQFEVTDDRMQLDLGGIPDGLYVLHLTGAGKDEVIRLVVQH